MPNAQVKSTNSTRAYSLVGILSVIALCNKRAAWKAWSASSRESVSASFQIELNLLQPGANILGACVIRRHAAFSPRAAPSQEAKPSALGAVRSMSGCRQPRQRQHLCHEGLHRQACFSAAPVAPRLEPRPTGRSRCWRPPRRVLLIQTNIPGLADMLRPDVLQSRPCRSDYSFGALAARVQWEAVSLLPTRRVGLARGREHRPQDATGVLSLWMLFREVLSPMG